MVTILIMVAVSVSSNDEAGTGSLDCAGIKAMKRILLLFVR